MRVFALPLLVPERLIASIGIGTHEERGDAEIHEAANSLDCRASLAMTRMDQLEISTPNPRVNPSPA
jgi:hypothetical protein